MDLDRAIEHAIDGNALLFLGAGFSRSAINVAGEKFKTGNSLALLLAEQSGLADEGPLDAIADYFIAEKGANVLVDLLNRQFQVAELGPEHTDFAQIRWKRIYTTNYDNVVETAFRREKLPVVPLDLSAPLTRIRENATQVVHINGFVESLDSENLQASFKLSDTSYSTGSFLDSPWSAQFQHDIATSRAVLFVGYSAYDLDIKRLLLSGSRDQRGKIFFIVGKTPPPLLRSTLEKFGTVAAEDTESLAAKIKLAQQSYVPADHQVVVGRYLSFVEPSSSVSTPRDNNVFDLLLWGKLDRDLVWGSVAGTTTDRPYVCCRESVNECLQLLEDGRKDIVVRSALGNGKTIFLECLGALSRSFGYTPVYFSETGAGFAEEIEEVLKTYSSGKLLFLVDAYSTKKDDLSLLARLRPDNLSVVYSARTLRHDTSSSWLYNLLGVEGLPEIGIDRLSEEDLRWLCDTLDSYGLWGNQASSSRHQKIRFLRTTCKASFSSALLAILEAPSIARRIEEVVKSIGGANRSHVEVVVCILALSVLEIGTNIEFVAGLVDREVLNQAAFRNNHAVKEIVDFGNGQIVARSAVVAQHILKKSLDPNVLVASLARMAAAADKLRADKHYFSVLRELMKFSSVQNILPLRHKMNAVLVYYERLKNLAGCRRNPNFWLQYAIATLALQNFADSRVKLETAYSFARERQGYNTFMIDNTLARLELEELIASPTTDPTDVMSRFRRSRNILNSQVSGPDFRHYPFRVATKYRDYFLLHRQVIDDPAREEFSRATRFILGRIEGLSSYRRRHPYVRECESALLELAGLLPQAVANDAD